MPSATSTRRATVRTSTSVMVFPPNGPEPAAGVHGRRARYIGGVLALTLTLLQVSVRPTTVVPAQHERYAVQVANPSAAAIIAVRVAVPAAQVLPVPRGTGLIDAAGLPEAAATLVSNLCMAGRFRAGETVLIHGATGGIGTFGIQLVKALGGRVAVTASSAAKLDAAARLGADILIDYTAEDFAQVMAEAGGADAISLINTCLGMAIDWRRRRPMLGNVLGGLSGPAIKPIALRCVFQAAQAVKTPLIGIGGIATIDDVMEFLVAGATAVQLGTANFYNPKASMEVLDGLPPDAKLPFEPRSISAFQIRKEREKK